MASLNSVPFCLDIDFKKKILFVICTDMWTTELNESVKFILVWVLLSFETQALSNTQVGDLLAVVFSCLGTHWLTLQPLRAVPHLNSMSFFHWIFLVKVRLRGPTLCLFLSLSSNWMERESRQFSDFCSYPLWTVGKTLFVSRSKESGKSESSTCNEDVCSLSIKEQAWV